MAVKLSFIEPFPVFIVNYIVTIKPVLSGHPREPSKRPLNTGSPLKTGFFRIRLEMVILLFLSIKKP